MHRASQLTTVFVLSLLMTTSSYLEAQAQRGSGGQRSGTYQRANARGKTGQGTWQSTRQTERGHGYRDNQRNTQVQTERGSYNRDRNVRTERTGTNTYQRNWDQTTTGPNGHSRTWSGEGTGTVHRNDGATTRDYQGTVTAPTGQEYGVDKTTTRTKTEDGWERDTSKTVTDSDGNVVGTGQSNSTGIKGEGVETTGSWTTPHRGETTYDRGVRWHYLNGQWVREAEGSGAGSSTLTVDR